MNGKRYSIRLRMKKKVKRVEENLEIVERKPVLQLPALEMPDLETPSSSDREEVIIKTEPDSPDFRDL